MMDDLFEYTSLNRTNVKMNIGILNISELILQMVDEFYPTFQEHDLNPQVKISDPNLFIYGDGQLIARILITFYQMQ